MTVSQCDEFVRIGVMCVGSVDVMCTDVCIDMCVGCGCVCRGVGACTGDVYICVDVV